MHFIDSHCHLHDQRVKPGLPGMIRRAEDAGVRYMVTCATMEENFQRTADLAQKYNGILPCFGIHPWFIDSCSRDWKETLATCLADISSGVGETGLDFMIPNADRDHQVRVFEAQLAMAVEMERPVNIHIRKAWESLIRVLKRFGTLKTPGLIHSYSGSADMVPVLEKYGLTLSFSGSVTNPGSTKVVRALNAVSPDRYVLETDSPDIQPYLSGGRITGLNEPANLPAIAAIAAQRINTDPDRFSRQAYENSLAVFDSVIDPGKKRKSSQE